MAETQIVVRFDAFKEAVQQNEGPFQESVSESIATAAPEDAEEQARLVAAMSNAIGALEEENTGSTVMSSARNGVASRLQSMLVERAAETGNLRQVRPADDVAVGVDIVTVARLLEVTFDSGDWLGWLKMSGLLLFKPERANWLAPPTVADPIADDAVLAVFSDWGTGLYGAPFITRKIEAMDRCDVVLHMGDTYYAGRTSEITGRLVDAWPKRDRALNRTLNGNHEMYSGGVGYFAALAQSPFTQSSSCFAMQNSHWLLLGLDTSYTDAALDDPQAAWIKSMVAGAGKRKVLLFSHHQVYSKFDTVGAALQTALAPLLTEGRIYGWFFGHEHRLVIFDPHPALGGMKARCMGHGGFPEFRQKLPGARPDVTQWISVAATPGVPAAAVLDGPNPFITDSPGDPVKYAPHGYLTLQFNGPDVYETYFDPAGEVTRAKERL